MHLGKFSIHLFSSSYGLNSMTGNSKFLLSQKISHNPQIFFSLNKNFAKP